MKLVPVDRLISRLRTDLKLAECYREKYCGEYKNALPGPEIDRKNLRKNLRKASVLFYLEEYRRLIAEKGAGK